MSLCPVCGRVYCDHTPQERGQTVEEMDRPLSEEELEAWRNNPDSTGYVPAKVAAAQKHAHDPTPTNIEVSFPQ